MSWLSIIALSAWAAWLSLLALPWQPWRIRERLQASPGNGADSFAEDSAEDLAEHSAAHLAEKVSLDDVAVLIPARNEAAGIEQTLAGVLAQHESLQVFVIDDQSDDDTAEKVSAFGNAVTLINGADRPQGWTGKLWALEQARVQHDKNYTLLLDADIELAPGVVQAMKQRLLREQRAFVSIMAELPTVTFWETLLMPAFIFFFRLLYPFHLSNETRWPVAAAAGGCVLMETRWIEELDLFRRIRGRLIDDCALAQEIKKAGGRPWIGLSRDVLSHRDSGGFRGMADMISRNAFTQLGHSTLVLILCTVIMGVMFIAPVAAVLAGLLLGMAEAQLWGLLAWLTMALAIVPTLKFYGVPLGYALLLPLVGSCYLYMTWQSAARYWMGQQSSWKGRVYETGFGA